MSTTQRQATNGVNVTQLAETVTAIQQDPTLATFRFRAATTWLGGGHSRTSIQGFWGAGTEDSSRSKPFNLDGDEPPVLLGSNQAPNAVETVLHALASCLAVGVAYNAAAQGIEIRALDFDLEGELDLHGFLGLSPDVRPGYQTVRVTYTIDSDAPDEQIDELLAQVQRTSPVLDIVSNPVTVTMARGT
ncbi:OsmC family protein [Intrasporangium sp.]|uniref:OsmC family protein n=1 Tax=Intrasporangium sp. TaxID=1925024 RepID=UPI00293A346F|nr:OsmC family protein [Intrasporangium sp.]MDV3221760.1 OsmC family protein [Intrasporangium sp.]